MLFTISFRWQLLPFIQLGTRETPNSLKPLPYHGLLNKINGRENEKKTIPEEPVMLFNLHL